MQDIDIVAT